METRLKERLIGATVLVLAAVLFIPMVLDGPDSRSRVSQSVPLPGAEQTSERRTVKIDLAAPASQEARVSATEPASIDLVPQQETAKTPAPINPSSNETGTEAQTVARTPAQTRSRETQQDDVKATAAAPAGEWTVQAGSFTDQDNAEALAVRLRELGFAAYVSRYDDAERVHFRVRVGGFPSRDAAQVKADELRDKSGEPARPVPAN